MRTVKIFLASSKDLRKDRDGFDLYIRHKNDEWIDDKDIRFKVERWEYGQGAMSLTRKQDDYNKILRSCDLFVMLYSYKVGMYTNEEFEEARKAFEENNSPLIYTYFKDTHVRLSEQKEEDLISLFSFKKRLKELGHFTSEYDSIESLNLHFAKQLDLLFQEGRLNGAVPRNIPRSKQKSLENLDRIRDEIAYSSSLSDVISEHQDFLLTLSPKLKAQIVALKRDWNNFETEKRIGLLGFSDANQRRTQLTYQFLQMLDVIEKEV